MFGGYLIDDRARARFGELALRGDEEKLWEWLDEDIGRLEPDYTYPPFLLSLALDLMRGSGWKGGVVPSELARAAGSADVDILLFQCADAALPQSEWSDEELSQFFESNIGEAWESAPSALREAVSYIQNGVTRAAAGASCFLLLLGS
jgi:hypothetical protein